MWPTPLGTVQYKEEDLEREQAILPEQVNRKDCRVRHLLLKSESGQLNPSLVAFVLVAMSGL